MPSDSSVSRSRFTEPRLPLTALRESETNPRKYFDARLLKELASSITEHGILEALIVRARESDLYEIVCGARRYRAAQMAGLPDVPVVIRDLTDDEVRIIQLVENGQRADLSPLEEAETYAALADQGLAVSLIAKRLGRKTTEIARRLPLARLPKQVRNALAAGTLPVEHAELLARIPDAKLQEEALTRVVERYDTGAGRLPFAVPYPAAKRIIEEEFMTALSLAVFDPEDAMLSPLGACSKCPHLAGNNPDLFGDVKGKAVCTNPKDFRLKTENHLKRLRETGYTVLLSPKELKRAFPHGESDVLSKEFADLERICPEDPKHRRYEELLGKAEKLNVVLALKNGRVRKLYPTKVLKAALAAAGHAFAKEKKAVTTKSAAMLSESALAATGREAVAQELATRMRTVKLTPSGWTDLLLRIVIREAMWKIETVIRRHGYAGSRQGFAEKREAILAERIKAMSEAERRAFLFDCLIGDWSTSADKVEQELYRHILKLAGVDPVKVAKRAIDEAKRQAEESKATPKPPIAARTARLPKRAATT